MDAEYRKFYNALDFFIRKMKYMRWVEAFDVLNKVYGHDIACKVGVHCHSNGIVVMKNGRIELNQVRQQQTARHL